MVAPFDTARSPPAAHGIVSVLSRDEVAALPRWRHSFASERKDHRYYELVEDTLPDGFDYRYFALRNAQGDVVAIQPFFLMHQDVVAASAAWCRGLVGAIRSAWPGFLRIRTMMVGCVAGEGHLDAENEASGREHAEQLAAAIVPQAKALGASLIVLKEFPARYRHTLQPFVDRGFVRIPSMPMTRLNIEYADFNQYMRTALSRGARDKLRRKFRAAARAEPIAMSVVVDASPYSAQIHSLYSNVHARSGLRFEKLTEVYLSRIGRAMPDKVRFFVWHQGARLIAFNLCLLEREGFCSEYVGFDYDVAFDIGLYAYIVRDMMSWGMTNGLKWFRSTALNYDPKRHLRHVLDPLDLYVRHSSALLNPLLRFVLPLLEPTRRDPVLPHFPNYRDLWGDSSQQSAPGERPNHTSGALAEGAPKS
ncbi:MAG: GNAT family N-acetyltransferase [Rhizobiales bacterium]|nr:GNAT family N-acetyltransferase [Hyphomicrobiales bacterium]